MAVWQMRLPAGCFTRALIVVLGFCWHIVSIESAIAQTDADDSVEARLDGLEQQSSALADENRQLKAQMDEMRQQSMPDSIPGPPTGSAYSMTETARFATGYDDGFVISPIDPDDTPFSLKFNNQTMFRYTGFGRDVRNFADSAGDITNVTNRSNFEDSRMPPADLLGERAVLPNLSYYVNIDYNTVTTQPIGFRGYWLSYRFSRAVEIFAGQNKVPGSREWLMKSISQHWAPIVRWRRHSSGPA